MFKQKGNPFKVTPCGRRRNYMTSPLKQKKYGESRGEGHKSGERFRSDPADKKAFQALNQKTKDSLHTEANKYGKPFFSPKHGVNVDPEDGVLSNRPVYSDDTKLTYEKIDKPFCKLNPQGRILIKTVISLELPTEYRLSLPSKGQFNFNGTIVDWFFQGEKRLIRQGINNLRRGLISYAVAEIRPISDNL